MLIRCALLLLLFRGATLSQDAPLFRSDTRLVQINVVGEDAKGPVAGLGKDDFSLLDRGRPQEISVFSVSTSAASQAPPPLARNMFANAQAGGPVTIVLIDRLNTFNLAPETGNRFTPRAGNALALTKVEVAKYFGEMDARAQVALYTLGDGLAVLSDFTSDRDQLLAALQAADISPIDDSNDLGRNGSARFPGRLTAQRFDPGDELNNFRARETLRALAQIAQRVASIPGRKNLVWITGDTPVPARKVAQVLSGSNLAVYPLDARGLTGRQALFGVGGIGPMTELASMTGGRALLNTNDFKAAIAGASKDGEASYTLGFYPESGDLDGKFHELKIEVKGAGLTLRYPGGYLAPTAARLSHANARNNIEDAIASPLAASAIPFVARLERVNRPRPNSLRVVCSIDLKRIDISDQGDQKNATLDLYVVQQDSSGRVIADARNRYDLHLNAERYRDYLASGLPLRQSVEAKPNLATLRVMVSDGHSGAVGSLVIPTSRIPARSEEILLRGKVITPGGPADGGVKVVKVCAGAAPVVEATPNTCGEYTWRADPELAAAALAGEVRRRALLKPSPNAVSRTGSIFPIRGCI